MQRGQDFQFVKIVRLAFLTFYGQSASWVQDSRIRFLILGNTAEVCARGVQKTEIRYGFGYKKIRTESEPSKNLTSVQTVFRETACNPHFKLKVTKLTLLAFTVQIKNVLKHDRNRV